LFRTFIEQRALAATTLDEAEAIAVLSAQLPGQEGQPDAIRASFWDRQSLAAMREERREDALLATLESRVVSTSRRRQRAAGLVAEDYPLLLASVPSQQGRRTVFDPANMLLTSAEGAQILQWSFATQELQLRESWTVTALEVVPLVRRVIVDREGSVSRIGLTLNISHARLSDLRIKIIAPSGRAVEIETGLERSSSNDDIQIPATQLRDLLGESLAGTWSISLRDEGLGIAGRLVGWNLKLNSQGAVEDFQRGLNIPDPVERETDNVWFDSSGRYVVARAMQSDSARIWDLAFAEPVRAIAVSENETLIGLDAGARHLVTATQGTINLWDTASGDRVLSLGVGATSSRARLTADGAHLFVEHRGDTETRLELWSLDDGTVTAELVVAGVPSLVAIDPTGSRVAVADYDRAVRVWDFASGELVAQIDLKRQPSEISLAAAGDVLGAVHGQSGVSLWNVEQPLRPLLQEFGDGDWQLVFAPSGASVLAGRAEIGYQTYSSHSGKLVGPPFGIRTGASQQVLLAYSQDEKVLFTGNPNGVSRFWRATEMPTVAEAVSMPNEHPVWRPSADNVMLALPETQGIVIGDSNGHVHILPTGAGLTEVDALREDVSFIGHNAEVILMRADRAGRFIASVAEDNSIRVWDANTGQPLPFMPEVDGDVVNGLSFSPDASLLAVLQSTSLSLLDTSDGSIVADLELGEPHRSLAFADNDQVYVGGESGALRLVARDNDEGWSAQQQWQGSRPIELLEASPRGNYLVIVDDAGLASQLILGEGRIGEQTLAFPGPVEEVTFSHSGSRVFLRTSRWAHRAIASINGLFWVDSVISPKPLNGGQIVFGPAGSETANRAYFPAARNGFVDLVELAFPGSARPGLFGNRNDLLAEWRLKLGAASAQGSPD
jgi:WD40 repeat protein